MATFILQILLSLFLQHSAAISCTGNCGPASEMQCNGFETCLSDTLQCSPNQDCIVECQGGSGSCRSATIQANGANELTVTCGYNGENQSDQCKASKINAQNIDGEIEITCTGGQHTCSYMEVYATGSDSLTIDCDTFESCQAMTINCAEDCYVHCNNAENNVCIGTSVICGSGHCEIDCSGGGQKCHSMGVIDASQASSFTCIGTSAECTGVGNQLITAEPTSPIPSPTPYPTPQPTPSPTQYPTPAPTPAPTSYPTPSPINPTSNPVTAVPTTAHPTTDMPTTSAPTTPSPTTAEPTLNPITSVPTTPEPTTSSPSTGIPTTNVPTITTEPTTTSTELSTNEQTTLVPTTYDPEAHVDETETPDQNGVNFEAGGANNSSWIYVAIGLAVILICVAGVLIFIKKRRAKHGQYYMDQKFKKKSRNNKVVMAVSPLSNMSMDGEGHKSGGNNTGTPGYIEQHLVDTDAISNIIMDDDIIDDIENFDETPNGTEHTEIEMMTNEGDGSGQNESYGTGEMLMDDEIIGDDVVTMGNGYETQRVPEGTDSDVDDIENIDENELIITGPDTVQ